jgi:hypothetical protein
MGTNLTEYEVAVREALGCATNEYRCSSAKDYIKVDTARYYLRSKFGYSIPDKAALDLCVSHCNAKILEVGAGTGYWAYELRKAGADVIATDLYSKKDQVYNFTKRWGRNKILNAPDAVAKYPDRSLFMSWPCYNLPWAHEALVTFREVMTDPKNQRFVFVGERRGGCTANDDFFEELDKHWELVKHHRIPKWPYLHDQLTIYKRAS